MYLKLMNTNLQSGDDSDWNLSSSPFAQASWHRSYSLSIAAMWTPSVAMHLGPKRRVGTLWAEVPHLSPFFITTSQSILFAQPLEQETHQQLLRCRPF